MAYCPPVDSKRNILLGNAGPNTKIPTKEREKERKREREKKLLTAKSAVHS